MDELQISGRRFISSRRIAKDNGYHTDYIGQLIRGGKVKGQKVGRTWYVDAVSFDAYLGQESTQEPTEQKSSGLLSSPKDGEAGQTFAPQVPAPAVAVIPVVVEKKVEEKKEEQKIEIKKIAEPVQARYVPVASGGLRFVADDEPLLPEISPKEVATHVTPQPEVVVHEQRRVRPARVMFALAGTAAAVFVFCAVVSSTVFQTIKVQQGTTASVGYSFQW